MKLPYNLKLSQSANQIVKDLTAQGFEFENDFSTLYGSFDWPNSPSILKDADIIVMLETEVDPIEELSMMVFPPDESYDITSKDVFDQIEKDQESIFAYFISLYGSPLKEGISTDEGMGVKTAYKAWKIENLFLTVAMDIVSQSSDDLDDEDDDLESSEDLEYVVSITFSTQNNINDLDDD